MPDPVLEDQAGGEPTPPFASGGWGRGTRPRRAPEGAAEGTRCARRPRGPAAPRRLPPPPPYLGGRPRCTRAHRSRPAGFRPSPSRPNIRSSLLPSPSYSHELPPGLGAGRRGSGVRGGGRERGPRASSPPPPPPPPLLFFASSFLLLGVLLLARSVWPPPPPCSRPHAPTGPPPNNETRAPRSSSAPFAGYQGRPATVQPGPGGGGAEWHIAGAHPPRAARSRAAPPAPLPGRGSHGRAPPLARSLPARPPPGKVLGSGNKAWLGRELFARALRAAFPFFLFPFITLGG